VKGRVALKILKVGRAEVKLHKSRRIREANNTFSVQYFMMGKAREVAD
jgi:hypothetical protein